MRSLLLLFELVDALRERSELKPERFEFAERVSHGHTLDYFWVGANYSVCDLGLRISAWKYCASGNLAGAEGFEPSPSSLTVRCPTSWTTPQRLGKATEMRAEQHDSGHACAG